MKKGRRILIFFITFISCVLLAVYLTWRIFFTFPVEFGFISMTIAFSLLFVEILGIFDTVIYYVNMNSFYVPDLPKIDKILFPSIDILVTIYNEPIEILKKTVLACLDLKYPDTNKINIFICDDGGRNEVKVFAKEVGVGYFSRTDKKNAKSGNLNNALFKTSSKLVANFDVDMIPCSDFLVSVVPYFLTETKNIESSNIGFVQTPQGFYEPDLFQKYLFSEKFIHNEQDYFYQSVQLSKNKSNSVIYGGTNAVFLRKALEEIGGFSSISITEDFATGILIQTKGYKCYATNKILASGLPPKNLRSLCAQRQRWACGCIQTGKRLGILTRSDLTSRQKINYFSSVIYWYFPIKQFLYLIVPILFSLLGVVSARCNFFQVLIFWFPMNIVTSLTLRILSGNTRTFHQTRIYETILSPILLIPVICEFFGLSNNEFIITEKKIIKDSLVYKIGFILPNLIFSILTILGIKNCFNWIILNKEYNQIIPIFWLILNFYFLIISIFFVFGRSEKEKNSRWLLFLKDIFKKSILPIILIAFCFNICYPAVLIFNDRKKFPPMNCGINIGNAFESPKNIPWDMREKVDNSIFDEIKNKGFDNIRLPVRFSDYLNDTKNIEPEFLEEIKNHIDYALNVGLTVILDLHHFIEIMQNPLANEEKFYDIWRVISKTFKDYPKSLVFELLNEPTSNLDFSIWNKFLSKATEIIREENKFRVIIFGPSNFYNIDYLTHLKVPKKDNNIMIAFHYYEPFLFAFQGNKWHPGYDKIKNVMWNGSEKELKYLSDRFKKVADYAKENQVKIILNEFGVTKEAPEECRIAYIIAVANEAVKNGFGLNYWEFGSGFGIYDIEKKEWNDKIAVPLVEVSKNRKKEWSNKMTIPFTTVSKIE